MSKTIKRMLSLLLCAVLLFSAIASGGISASADESYAAGDIICYGSYPQSKVTDAQTLAALNALTLTWRSYGYYTGTGQKDDGEMVASDYMRYADVSHNGQKYRAVKFDLYRPDWAGGSDSTTWGYQKDNGYFINTVYWFRYEPIQWRVLDPETGLVRCNTIIDSQPYQNYLIKSGDNLYCNPEKTHYACDYANSSIRAWLNDQFYKTAFSAAEKKNIAPTVLDNRSWGTLLGYDSYHEYDSASTTDNVFLFGSFEADGGYGIKDREQRFSGTDYARSQGLWAKNETNQGYASWWLRTPCDRSDSVCGVNQFGNESSYFHTYDTSGGVVPAIRFKSLKSQAFCVIYNANGGMLGPANQAGNGTVTLSTDQPVRNTYDFCGWATSAAATTAQYQPGDSIVLTENITLYAVWKRSVENRIDYGSYPQSQVTDAQTLAALNALSLTWRSYGYYSGSGSYNDGQMVASDYMRYADVSYNGHKYRAVVFNSYRPTYTSDALNDPEISTVQERNGFSTGTVYWFRYEPIRWRILDPAAGLILCDSVLDSQAYQNYVSGKWGDPGQTHYACDYANSSIRAWLNGDFYNTAFSSAEKNNILPTELDNSCYNPYGYDSHHKYDSASTTDKVFLLSYSEASAGVYGLDSGLSRMLAGTDYARCQGLSVGDGNSACWWLRSPESDASACYIDSRGFVTYRGVSRTWFGVVPALRLQSLEPQQPETYTVSYDANGGSGAPTDQIKYQDQPLTLSSIQPTRSDYTFTGWNTKADGSGTSYAAGADYTANAGVILYAQWTKNTAAQYTVTYNPKGGSVSPTSASVAAGGSVTLPTPTKSYRVTYKANGGSGAPSTQTVSLTCKGWATSGTATSAAYNCGASYKPTASVTLYAVWNSSSSTSVSSTKPTNGDKTFLGWSLSSAATSATYKSGDTIELTGDVTLYAVWETTTDPTEPTDPAEPSDPSDTWHGFINWVLKALSFLIKLLTRFVDFILYVFELVASK